MPAAPKLPLEDEAQALAGNALLRLLLDRKPEIEQGHPAWKERAKLKEETHGALAHGGAARAACGTDARGGDGPASKFEGIREGRQLLEQDRSRAGAHAPAARIADAER